MVVCLNNVTVDQWIAELRRHTNINERFICRHTSEKKDEIPDGFSVQFTTYAMACRLTSSCDLLILDEVHVAPADTFRTIMARTKAPHRLGFTATLIREDDKVADLHELVGPVGYSIPCETLIKQGWLAAVDYHHVLCTFPMEWRARYDAADGHMRLKLCAQNPTKYKILQELIKRHKDDKVLVYADSTDDLQTWAIKLQYPVLFGKVRTIEREMILTAFETTDIVNVLFLSRVGDAGIDLPSANVAIQVDSHGRSRRQEGQRLGRIMRPNAKNGGRSIFYSLVTPNTREMEFATQRRQYLVDTGRIQCRKRKRECINRGEVSPTNVHLHGNEQV